VIASKEAKVLNLTDLSVFKNVSSNTTVLSANLSPLNSKIALAKADKTVDVYDINGSKLYTISNLTAQPISVIFATEEITITASSVENPTINLWYNGKLLRKWVQTIE